MADNIVLNSGSGGSTLAAASLTVSGDTAIVQMVGCGILSGSEGSWSLAQMVGGAGAVAAGVQRVTLASDDPAVTDLAAIEVLLTGIDADTDAIKTALQGTLTVGSHAVTLATLPDTAAGDLAAMVVDLAAMEVLLGTIDADTGAIKTAVELIDNAISGTEMQVDVVAALPAGDNNIGNVDIASSVALDVSAATVTVTGTVTANLSATDNAVLDSIATNTTGLAGCVGGTEVQVDVVASLPAGTNAIGKLAANSGVDIGDVDVTSIAAGTNTIGGVIAQASTSVAYDGTTSCTIKRASGLAASGTTAMVAAVVGKKIRVLALQLIATSATVTNVYVANDDNNLLGDASNPIALATDADGDNIAGLVMPWNPGGWFETDTANEALNLVLSAAQDVIYALTYIEVA